MRHRTGVILADEGIDPFQTISISSNWDDTIAKGRARVVEQLSKIGGRQVSVIFLEEIANGPILLDKFRLSVANAGTGGLTAPQQRALENYGAYKIERLSGSHFYFIFINQQTYDRRALCGAFDLSWSQIIVIVFLNTLALLLLIWVASGSNTKMFELIRDPREVLWFH